MLVKKIDPEWFPMEAPELGVGETVELHTDPARLIMEGKVEIVKEAPQKKVVKKVEKKEEEVKEDK